MHSMLSPQPSSLTIIPLPLVVVALVPGIVRLRVLLKGLIRRAEIGSVVARLVTVLVALLFLSI